MFYASRERRYQEQTAGKPPAIGTLYVQKWLLGESPPPTLSVTIQEGAR